MTYKNIVIRMKTNRLQMKYILAIEKLENRLVMIRKSTLGIRWSYVGASNNTLIHSISGNRKIGYKVGMWNCRKGLLNPDGSPSPKMTDIQLYLEKHKLDLFGIVESDLHGQKSRVFRKHNLT